MSSLRSLGLEKVIFSTLLENKGGRHQSLQRRQAQGKKTTSTKQSPDMVLLLEGGGLTLWVSAYNPSNPWQTPRDHPISTPSLTDGCCGRYLLSSPGRSDTVRESSDLDSPFVPLKAMIKCLKEKINVKELEKLLPPKQGSLSLCFRTNNS